jgi:hypothetical protein
MFIIIIYGFRCLSLFFIALYCSGGGGGAAVAAAAAVGVPGAAVGMAPGGQGDEDAEVAPKARGRAPKVKAPRLRK